MREKIIYYKVLTKYNVSISETPVECQRDGPSLIIKNLLTFKFFNFNIVVSASGHCVGIRNTIDYPDMYLSTLFRLNCHSSRIC